VNEQIRELALQEGTREMNNEPVAWRGEDYDGVTVTLYYETERNKLPYRLYHSAVPLYEQSQPTEIKE
jgi:hypothetical protein